MVTSNARVESRPPETPITTLSNPICDNRLTSPCACILYTSDNSSSLTSIEGMKGYGLIPLNNLLLII